MVAGGVRIELRGRHVPALGFGTWDLRGDAARDMVAAALDIGYRHVDTAQAYGNEEDVGNAIVRSGVPREDIFLTTKIWMDKLDRKGVPGSTDQSLRKLKTDYVDLLLIHWPNPDVELTETLDALVEVKQSGQAREIGISNFPVALMRQAVEEIGAPIFCNQVEYHPFLSQKKILSYAGDHDILVTAYSPLAQGGLNIFQNPVLAGIASAHGKSVAQVVLRWLVQQKNVCAIPKTKSRGHAEANFSIFDFTLTPEDMAAISGLGGDHRVIDPSWAPQWDRA